jgi:hypothetical protein
LFDGAFFDPIQLVWMVPQPISPIAKQKSETRALRRTVELLAGFGRFWQHSRRRLCPVYALLGWLAQKCTV